MKGYQLQKLIDYDEEKKVETWKRVFESDNLDALKRVCPDESFRIIDNRSGNIVYVIGDGD